MEPIEISYDELEALIFWYGSKLMRNRFMYLLNGVINMESIAISFQELDALIRWHETMADEYIDKNCYAEAQQHRFRRTELEAMYIKAQEAHAAANLQRKAIPDVRAREKFLDAVYSELHGKKMGD